MKVIEYEIKDIILANHGRYFLQTPRDLPWHIQPRFGYRFTKDPSVITEVIGIEAFCCIGNTDARISVVTEIEIKYEGNIDIVGEENHRLFVTFLQIAMAHTRVMFNNLFAAYEHSKYLLPLFSDDDLYERVKITEQQNMN